MIPTNSKINIDKDEKPVDSKIVIEKAPTNEAPTDEYRTIEKRGRGRPKKRPTLSPDDPINKKPSKPLYQCTCCGRKYTAQVKNFMKTQSAFWQANDGYVTVCNECVEKMLIQYTKSLGSEIEAIKRIALHFDLFVSSTLLNTKDKGIGRLGKYVKGLNLGQYAGKTYDTYLDSVNKDLVSYNTIGTDTPLTKEQIERWGTKTYDLDEISILEEHYQYLKKCNPNVDNNQEIFIKDLCNINLFKIKAIKLNDVKRLNECNKDYRETFKMAGLKTIVETDDSKNATLGMTMAMIEQYCPAEYYKNQRLYRDFDGIGKAHKRLVKTPMGKIKQGNIPKSVKDKWYRFVFRPLKNFRTGDNEKDPEFNLDDE